MTRTTKTKPKKTRIKSFKQFVKDQERQKELAGAISAGQEPVQGSSEAGSDQSQVIPLQVNTLVS